MLAMGGIQALSPPWASLLHDFPSYGPALCTDLLPSTVYLLIILETCISHKYNMTPSCCACRQCQIEVHYNLYNKIISANLIAVFASHSVASRLEARPISIDPIIMQCTCEFTTFGTLLQVPIMAGSYKENVVRLRYYQCSIMF